MSDDTIQTNIDISATDRSGQVLAGVAENMKKISAAASGALAGSLRKAGDAAKDTGNAISQHIGQRSKDALNSVSVAAGAFAERLSGIPLGAAAAGVAVEELARRSYTSFAAVQRGMEQLQFSTGATNQQIAQLKKTFDDMGRATGESIEQLQHDFGTFLASSGLGVSQATKAFRDIGVAASVAGVSVEGLAHAAGAAFANLRITSDADRRAVIDAWAIEVPTALMDAWTQVAPRLTQDMATLGFTGRQSAIDIAAMFNQVAASLGSGRLAASSLSSVLQGMGSISSTLGQMLLPTLERVQQEGGSSLDVLKAAIDLARQFGAFSSDPTLRESGRLALGLDDNGARALQAVAEHWEDIKKNVEATGSAVERVQAQYDRQAKDAESSVRRLGAEVEKLGDEFGKFLEAAGAGQALDETAASLDTIANSIGVINKLLKNERVDWGEFFNMTGLKASWEYFKDFWAENFAELRHMASHPLAAVTEPMPKQFLEARGRLALMGAYIDQGKSSTSTSAPQAQPGGFNDRWDALPHFAGGGIVRSPTIAEIGEAGPEAIVPLGGFGSTATERNTEATEENTSSINRLSTWVSGLTRERRNVAFTPGAGGAATPAVAGLLPHVPGGGGDLAAALGDPSQMGGGGGGGGGSWWQSFGPHLPGGSPTQGSPAPGGVIGPGGGVAPGPHATPEGVVPKGGGRLGRGAVDPTALYQNYVDKFRNSKLNGFVPRDGARWGIKTGSPEEWARLALATSRQESGLNPNAPGGGLNQFEAGDLARWGVRGAVNDPNAQTQALVNQWTKDIPLAGVVSEPGSGPGTYSGWGGAGAYFGSMRFGPGSGHGSQPDMAKYMPWAAGIAAGAAGGSAAGGSDAGQAPSTDGSVRPGAPIAQGATPASVGNPDAFIVHHTSGRGTFEDVQGVLRGRHLGVEYILDRNGVVHVAGGPGSKNIKNERGEYGTALGRRLGLNNSNVVGMEVIAKNDKDVLPAQVAAARKFIETYYPHTPVYGHGEIQKDKESDEGRTIVNAIRGDRARAASAGGAAASSDGGASHYDTSRVPHWDIGSGDTSYGNSHFKNMLREHRAMRAEMERPIKTNFLEPSKRPSAATQRRQIANRESRWRSDAMLASTRNSGSADVGIT